ncbi:unnamed protein product [Ilex paraguariensis]|uniref:NADP-dependent oxidoreductase domain-containing protein n=1 Tax=Ilex paraguariensis TaxID=185542 RepID=A0ABC8TE86_9AQUA
MLGFYTGGLTQLKGLERLKGHTHACEASLKGLDIDFIDLNYVHCIDTRVPIEITTMPRFQLENFEHKKKLYEQVNIIATRKGRTIPQLALSWVHHQGDDVSPILGTTKIKNFNQNVGALSIKLTPDEMVEPESIDTANAVKGESYSSSHMAFTWRFANTPPLSSWKAK